jgi:hypothetical protein
MRKISTLVRLKVNLKRQFEKTPTQEKLRNLKFGSLTLNKPISLNQNRVVLNEPQRNEVPLSRSRRAEKKS